MWQEDLFREMEQLRDEERAVKMSAYMRNLFPFLGVPRPSRGEASRRWFPKPSGPVDWDFVERCYQKDEREYQYLAIDYLNASRKHLALEDLPRIRSLILRKSWWDCVDGLPKLVGEILERQPEGTETILAWSRDEDFWVRRVAILHQLGRKARTDRDLLERCLADNLGSREFFINKAIGWALREFGKTDPDWVVSFLDRYRDRLAPLSLREGSRRLPLHTWSKPI